MGEGRTAQASLAERLDGAGWVPVAADLRTRAEARPIHGQNSRWAHDLYQTLLDALAHAEQGIRTDGDEQIVGDVVELAIIAEHVRQRVAAAQEAHRG